MSVTKCAQASVHPHGDHHEPRQLVPSKMNNSPSISLKPPPPSLEHRQQRPKDPTRSPLDFTMGSARRAFFLSGFLVLSLLVNLCSSDNSFTSHRPSSSNPYGQYISNRAYAAIKHQPSAKSPSSFQQPQVAESSNIVHKFKFAFHNRPHSPLADEVDDIERTAHDLTRRSHFSTSSSLPSYHTSNNRVHRYLPGSSSAIYVDSSEELLDDFERDDQFHAQRNPSVTRQQFANLKEQNENVDSQENDKNRSFEYKVNNNHSFKNIVIPLPTHRLNDRSLATGVIVISQDNGFPPFGRHTTNEDIARHYHYELLRPVMSLKEEKQVDGSQENVTNNENKANRSTEANELPSSDDTEGENDLSDNSKREVEKAASVENETESEKKDKTVTFNEGTGNKQAALTITLEDKHSLDSDLPVKSRTKPSDFIASSLKARIHLSRPSTNAFNINLIKTTTSGRENTTNNESQGQTEPKVLLLVERETLQSKVRSNGKKHTSPSAIPIARTLRRSSKPPQSASITLNSNAGKDNFILKQRRNDKLMRLNMTLSSTANATNSTESPEFTTTSILNSIVKELNLALSDRIRLLESINHTQAAAIPLTSSESSTTLASTLTPESPSTTVVPTIELTTSGSINLDKNDDLGEASSTTTAAPAEFTTEQDSVKRNVNSSEEDEDENKASGETELNISTTKGPREEEEESASTTIANLVDSREDSSSEESSTVTPSEVTTALSSGEINSFETDSEESKEDITTTTSTTTTTTTTPAPITTTKAPITSKPKSKKSKSPRQVSSVSNKKSAKKSSKLTTTSTTPTTTTTSTIAPPTKLTALKPATNKTETKKESGDLKLKMSFTLHNKTQKPEQFIRVVTPASVRTTIKPKDVRTFRLAVGISSNGAKNQSKVSTHWKEESTTISPAKFIWNTWTSTSKEVKTTTVRPTTTTSTSSPALVERRPPGPPKIPNNFGFANTIRDSAIFDADTDEDESKERELAKRLTNNAKNISEVKPTGSISKKESSKAKSKKVERERDYEEDEEDDNGDEDDDLSDSNVPGIPGVDYPVLGHIPDTGFDCSKQEYPGFYSDISVGCQVYHSCSLASIARPAPPGTEFAADHDGASSSLVSRQVRALGSEYSLEGAESSPQVRRIQSSRKSGLNGGKHSFLCPNGTIFSQEYLICDWWYNVKCEESRRFYPLNRDVFTSGQFSNTAPKQHQTAASNVVTQRVIPGEYATPPVHYHNRILSPSDQYSNTDNVFRPYRSTFA